MMEAKDFKFCYKYYYPYDNKYVNIKKEKCSKCGYRTLDHESEDCTICKMVTRFEMRRAIFSKKQSQLIPQDLEFKCLGNTKDKVLILSCTCAGYLFIKMGRHDGFEIRPMHNFLHDLNGNDFNKFVDDIMKDNCLIDFIIENDLDIKQIIQFKLDLDSFNDDMELGKIKDELCHEKTGSGYIWLWH